MNTIMVWVLVTFVSNGYGNFPIYSPPVSTLKECQQIAKAYKNQIRHERSLCLHIKMVK